MVSPLLATSRDRATWTTMNVAGLITGKHGVALCISVSGAHNKPLQTEWLKQQQFASHGSRDWRSKVKVSAGPRSPQRQLGWVCPGLAQTWWFLSGRQPRSSLHRGFSQHASHLYIQSPLFVRTPGTLDLGPPIAI